MKIRKCIFLLLLWAIIMTIPGTEELNTLAAKVKPSFTIVVDPGHGGPDGGTIGTDGTEEADLNLAIAKLLKKEGEKRGMQITLTRENKEGLYAADNLEKRWSKLDDMKQRKIKMEARAADAAISLHMNSFPTDTTVRGAQVFYPETGSADVLDDSKSLAESIQNSLNAGLKNSRERTHMEKGDVFLLENPTVPIVLIECGFLSNPEDLAHLKTKAWQKNLVTCILDGLQTWTEI